MFWLFELGTDKQTGECQVCCLIACEVLGSSQGQVTIKDSSSSEEGLVTVASLLVELEHELHGEGSIVNLDVLEAALLGRLKSRVLDGIKIVVNAISLFC